MTDYFAVLGEPRRPFLDPERIKDRFHCLSRERHPDQAGGGEEAFAELNLAQETLRDPKLRLRHLLALECPKISTAGPAGVPDSLGEEFAPVHELLAALDAFLPKKAAAAGALGRALLSREETALRGRARERLVKLEAQLAQASADLRAFDRQWQSRPFDTGARLLEFYQRFAYLSRWIEQLRERAFGLEL